jgi:type I restriction enzyme S subunit
MSERTLLERFDLVADHPENIPLLRRYIVDLAVRGKLLEKTALDISASEMLKRIEATANALVKQGKLKKQKPMASIGAEEIPATYVAHCSFERLGYVANLQKGLTGIQSAIQGEFPLVVTAASRSTCDHYDFDGAAVIIPMVSSTGHGNASLNRLHYQEGKFALGTILCAVFPIDEKLISARFLFEYLTAFKDELLVSKMNGTANVTLTVGKIAEVPVPIIAPVVQRRVDELMALCDQLAAAQNEREARRDQLVAASLNRIGTATAATSGTAIPDAARFHLKQLSRLTTRPAHIKQLRQTILNLAVRGKLVPQDPNEEPASELIKRIQAEKSRLEKQGTLKSTKNLPSHSIEASYELPATWSWERLGNLITLMDAGWSPQCENHPRHSPEMWGILKTTAVQALAFDAAHHKELPVKFNPRPNYEARVGDILITRAGPKNRVGISCVVDVVEPRLMISDKLIRFHLLLDLNPDFFALALNAGYSNQCIEDAKSGMAVMQMNISQDKLKLVPVPIAPINEQHRIVAKVAELMALCDRLEAQLNTTDIDSRRLLEAVLHEALAPALEEAA